MKNRGFTLIELLVVITILAILAGAALPYVQNYVAESRIAKAKADLEEIARALVVYETREGDYEKDNVSDLTGRYLNKAPIDPWGAQYEIDVKAGIVYSKGPDRKDNTTSDNYDNINVAYQPPLALVSAKWIDKNQSGAVDIQNVNDELHLTFSRKFSGAVTLANIAAQLILSVEGSTKSVSGNFGTPILVSASKVLTYKLATEDVFVAGRDSIYVKSEQKVIYDQATPDKNYCLSDQIVKILAQ